MTAKEALHELVDVLDDSQAREALVYLHRLVATEESSPVEERSTADGQEFDDEGVEYLKRGGATSVDGKMVDRPVLARAEKILEMAARLKQRP